jgi:hypothetical protein
MSSQTSTVMARALHLDHPTFSSIWGATLMSMKLVMSVALIGAFLGMQVFAQDKGPAAAGGKSEPAAEKEAAMKKDEPATKPAAKPVPKTGKTPPAKPLDKRTGATSGKGGSAPADGTAPGAGGDPLPDSSASKTATANGIAAEPNWQFEEIALQPYGTTGFTRDKISLNPPDGHSFVEVRFRVTALRHDPKAIESYAKVWKNVNRKELTQRSKLGARAFEMRHLALTDAAGVRYQAIWNLDEAVRYNVYTAEIQQNSTSQTHQGFWKANTATTAPIKWLDSEQSFLTKTIRPPNRPAIVEQVTYFSGILEVANPVDVNFLFGIPDSVDRESLSLVYESRPYAMKRTTVP